MQGAVPGGVCVVGRGFEGRRHTRGPIRAAKRQAWRRGPELNRRIEVLQTSALPLGYRAEPQERRKLQQKIWPRKRRVRCLLAGPCARRGALTTSHCEVTGEGGGGLAQPADDALPAEWTLGVTAADPNRREWLQARRPGKPSRRGEFQDCPAVSEIRRVIR